MRRVVVSLLALVVLLPSVALAHTRYACAIDQIVRDACCCPAKPDRPTTAPIVKSECCKVEKRAATVAPPATVASTSSIDAPVVTCLEIALVVPPLRVRELAVMPRAQAPPRESSLLSLHCSLLV